MQIYRFFTAWVKIHQVSHVVFQTKSEFFFKNRITLQCHERSLLYFFSWNCTWISAETCTIWTNVADQSAKFQTFDWSSKISPNLYFNRLLKVYKILAEKYRGVMSYDSEKQICCFKKGTFKKYVRSRFLSFDPPPPTPLPFFVVVCFRAPPLPPTPSRYVIFR